MTTVVQLDVDLTASYYATPSCFVFGHSRTAGAEKTNESATQHSFSALLAARSFRLRSCCLIKQPGLF